MAEDADLKQSIRDQTYFSTTLAAHLSKKHDSNIVFSPLSIHVALSVLTQGTKGRTHDQLLAFLKTSTANNLNSLYSHVVSSIFEDGSPNDEDAPRLSLANGVWVDKTLFFKPSFQQVLDNVYKAACKQVDFHTKADEVAEEVNLWAEKQTNGLIKGLVPADALDSFTRLVFANAVYFKGTWHNTFDPEDTIESDFHLLGGSTVQVPFMTGGYIHNVGEYDDFKVLGLSYLGGEKREKCQFTMYFFLPDAKDGLQSLAQRIGSTSDFIDSHIPCQAVEVNKFMIPKFKIEFSFKACDMLKELGIVLPFYGEDGLTEMADSSTGETLYVSSIHHKSYMEVNEGGTEAAASTFEADCGCAFPEEEPIKVVLWQITRFLCVKRKCVRSCVVYGTSN